MQRTHVVHIAFLFQLINCGWLCDLAHAMSLYSVTDLRDLPGGESISTATAINRLGHVVGWSHTSEGQRAFLWRSEVRMIDLGTLLGREDDRIVTASGINDLGQVVGTSAES